MDNENKEIYENVKPELSAEQVTQKIKSENFETTESLSPNETLSEQAEEDNETDKTGSDIEDSQTESDDADIILEREEGDGQESTPNKKIDDDEDKRNPQYIPKRGTFYEHDDRTNAEEEDEETEANEKPDQKKKVWTEKEVNKWSHDRYNDQEQAPKSRSELIAIYGYDIRNEEGPPRSRRRRRYGRGPNKYTRNWEDEEAYSKPTNVSAKPIPRKPRKSKEEFPPLTSNSSGTPFNSIKSSDEFEGAASERKVEIISETKPISGGEVKSHVENGTTTPPKRDTYKKIIRTPPKPKFESVATNAPIIRGTVTKTRGYFRNGGRGIDTRNQKNQKSPSTDYSNYIASQNYTNKTLNDQQQQQQNIQKLEKEMANLNVQQHEYNRTTVSGVGNRGGKYIPSGNNRQASVPPRLQAEQRGSKRYSSLRQRSLPETATSSTTFSQPPQFFQTEFGQQAASNQQTSNQSILGHPHTQNTSTSTLLAANGAPPPPPILQAPYAPTFAQTAPFLPASVAPPQFLPQQAPPPSIINYGQPPQPYPQPPTFTNFQHQQFNPVNQGQPTELYQPQGGITYYSTQSQQVIPRVAQKRVKSAIPIVPPPEHADARGRRRSNQNDDPSDNNQESLGLDSVSGVKFQSDASVVVQP